MTSTFSVHSAPFTSVQGFEAKTPGSVGARKLRNARLASEVARSLPQVVGASRRGRRPAGGKGEDDDGEIRRIDPAHPLRRVVPQRCGALAAHDHQIAADDEKALHAEIGGGQAAEDLERGRLRQRKLMPQQHRAREDQPQQVEIVVAQAHRPARRRNAGRLAYFGTVIFRPCARPLLRSGASAGGVPGNSIGGPAHRRSRQRARAGQTKPYGNPTASARRKFQRGTACREKSA